MEEVVVTSVILFPFLLFCLSAIQEAVLTPPEQIGWFHRSEFSVKDIFTDNHNWDRYYYHHRREIRPVEREEVEKMMSCKGTDRGCYVYQCPKCGTQMEFVMFFKKDPPLLSEKWGFGTKLDDWNYLCAT